MLRPILTRGLVALALATSLLLSAPAVSAAGTDPFQNVDCTGAARSSAICKTPTNATDPLTRSNGVFHTVTQLVALIGGAVAIIVIVLAGIRYITSAGNAEQAAKAKNAIVFAVIGLIVILAGQAIITFVIKGI